MKKSAVCIQSYARMWQTQKTFKLTLKKREDASIMIQKWVRRFLAAKKLQNLREDKAATTLQKYWKCYSNRKEYLQFRCKIILLQSHVRKWREIKAYRSQLAKREEAAIVIQKYVS